MLIRSHVFISLQVLALACVQFLAHLVNQQVAHEVVALELLMLLLEKPTDDSVEMAVTFSKECGQALTELSPKGCQGMRGIITKYEILTHHMIYFKLY